MDNVHLVNFFQLTLKSKNDFDAAFDLVLSTKLSEYLKLFLIPQPADWPAQVYSRQVIYETLQKFCCPSDVFSSVPHRSFICKSLLFWTHTTTNER